MCYILLLSTTSSSDLTAANTGFLRFDRELPTMEDSAKLKYPHQWYVGSKSGCSCSFRHLLSVDLGFGEPVEWFPEDADDITATLQFIRVVRELVGQGERVDCVDAWEHNEMRPLEDGAIEVNLATISDREFRLFENHHFDFVDVA